MNMERTKVISRRAFLTMAWIGAAAVFGGGVIGCSEKTPTRFPRMFEASFQARIIKVEGDKIYFMPQKIEWARGISENGSDIEVSHKDVLSYLKRLGPVGHQVRMNPHFQAETLTSISSLAGKDVEIQAYVEKVLSTGHYVFTFNQIHYLIIQ